MYTENYYKSLNYSNYLERSVKYDKLFKDLNGLFTSLKILKKEDKILDYGCAVGFLAESFQKSNFKNVYCYDISEWAINQCKNKNLKTLTQQKLSDHKFRLTFFLDVLEHMSDTQIKKTFQSINSDIILGRIPVAKNKGEDYYLEISRRDKTHINCKTKEDWIEFINDLGYTNILLLNMLTIYDSDGVFCFIGFKKGLKHA